MDSELATAQERHSAELQEMWRAENEAGKTRLRNLLQDGSVVVRELQKRNGPPTVDCFICRLLKRKRQTTNSPDSAIQQTGSGPQQNIQIKPSFPHSACIFPFSLHLQKLLVARRSLQEQIGGFQHAYSEIVVLFFTRASQEDVRQTLFGWDKKTCIDVHFFKGLRMVEALAG